MQRKEETGKRKKYKERYEKTKRLWFANGFVDTFLKSNSDEDDDIVLFSTLDTVTQNQSGIQNPVKHLRWSSFVKILTISIKCSKLVA